MSLFRDGISAILRAGGKKNFSRSTSGRTAGGSHRDGGISSFQTVDDTSRRSERIFSLSASLGVSQRRIHVCVSVFGWNNKQTAYTIYNPLSRSEIHRQWSATAYYPATIAPFMPGLRVFLSWREERGGAAYSRDGCMTLQDVQMSEG